MAVKIVEVFAESRWVAFNVSARVTRYLPCFSLSVSLSVTSRFSIETVERIEHFLLILHYTTRKFEYLRKSGYFHPELSPWLGTLKKFATAYRQSTSVFIGWPSPVDNTRRPTLRTARWSAGRDAARRAVRPRQLRLVVLIYVLSHFVQSVLRAPAYHAVTAGTRRTSVAFFIFALACKTPHGSSVITGLLCSLCSVCRTCSITPVSPSREYRKLSVVWTRFVAYSQYVLSKRFFFNFRKKRESKTKTASAINTKVGRNSPWQATARVVSEVKRSKGQISLKENSKNF